MEYNAAIQMSRPGYPSPVAIADSSQFPRTRPQDDRAGGIESAMWQMSLRSSEIAEAGPYPERPGEQDCAYYMRTGLCRFGMTCRFNHPPNRKLAVAAARMKGGYPERIGQPECQRENLDELLSNNDGGVMQGVADSQTRLEPLTMTKQSWLPHHVSVSFRVKSETQSWSSTHEASDLVNHKKGVSFCSSATMRCFDDIMSMFICLQYYLKTGTCKFGATCKFHHPRDKAGVAGRVLLNVLGYPLRPNEKECAYYLRTGQCKYGGTCKFHHPQPISLRGSAIYSPIHSPTTPGQQSYPSGLTNWPLSRAPFVASPRWQGPASYAQLILPQGVVPVPGWNTYTGQLSSMSSSDGQQQNLGTGQYYGTSRQNDTTNAGGQGTFSPYRSSSVPMGLFALQRENIFPERPDQPECQFYMKTGDCKFGAVCRFHHPRERLIPAPNCVLSPMGLPLRPGEPLCTFYSHYGICKFGPTCKFDHPMSAVAFSLPTSSSDVPVVRRLLGTSSGTPVLPLTSEVSGEVSSGKSRRLPLSDTRQMSSGDESIENEGTHTA